MSWQILLWIVGAAGMVWWSFWYVCEGDARSIKVDNGFFILASLWPVSLPLLLFGFAVDHFRRDA